MKNICVITGASSGIGREFFDQLVKRRDYKFDEFWVIARGADKLAELRVGEDEYTLYDYHFSRFYGQRLM